MIHKHALQYSIDIPYRQRNRFLIKVLSPYMKRHQRKNLVDSWFFMPGGEARNPNSENILVNMSLPPKASLIKTEKKFTLLFQTHCRKMKGTQFVDLPSVSRHHLLARYGGKRGIEIFSEFAIYHTQLVLKLLTGLKKKSFHISQDILGLMLIHYFMETLGIDVHKRSFWLDKWIHAFSDIIDSSGKLLQTLYETATNTLRKEEKLCEILRLLKQGNFYSVSPKVSFILDRYRTTFSQIGKALRNNENNFRPGHPRQFVIFHSYVHTHFLCLGFSNFKELCLESLALCETRSFQQFVFKEKRRSGKKS